jgi:hypothetical protein
VYPLPFQRIDEIAQQRRLGARVHVETELDVQLPRIDAERDGRQHDDSRSGRPCAPRRFGGDYVALDHVGGVRQMVVMGLGGAPREHGNFVLRGRHGLPVRLGEDIRTGHSGNYTRRAGITRSAGNFSWLSRREGSFGLLRRSSAT